MKKENTDISKNNTTDNNTNATKKGSVIGMGVITLDSSDLGKSKEEIKGKIANGIKEQREAAAAADGTPAAGEPQTQPANGKAQTETANPKVDPQPAEGEPKTETAQTQPTDGTPKTEEKPKMSIEEMRRQVEMELERLNRKQELAEKREIFIRTKVNLSNLRRDLDESKDFEVDFCKLTLSKLNSAGYDAKFSDMFKITNREILLKFCQWLDGEINSRLDELESELVK